MYENITYAELKKLPKEQKIEAWKELVALTPKKKDLAVKLGVSPAIVYNMISRYVSDKSEQKQKQDEDETPVKLKPRRARQQKRKVENVDLAAENQDESPAETPENSVVSENSIEHNVAGKEAFSIAISKIVSGGDARILMTGIGSTLLNDREYSVEVKITEK